MNGAIYSHINEPNSKRRDLLNLAIESIDLIKRTDGLKELRERKVRVMDALREEIKITNKAINHFHKLVPFNVKNKKERITEKVWKSKVKSVHTNKVNKLDNLSSELENIKNKLNKLDF